jgi:GMP synthase (glutamine-hydrolysing)
VDEASRRETAEERSMKKIYVIQHVQTEPLGIWEEELQRWYAPFEYVPLWEGKPLPAPESTLAAIVMGGPMNVSDQGTVPFLRPEIEYLQELCRRRTHVLGVCLGAQLLAASLGAQVGPGPRAEIGYMTLTLTPTGAEDVLLSGFPMELPVFQWHGQGFDLPDGATRLATSPDYENQAFRAGNAWGFQFHLEVTPQLVDEWAVLGANEIQAVGLSRAKLAEQAGAHGQMVALYGRQVIRRFWDSVAEM